MFFFKTIECFKLKRNNKAKVPEVFRYALISYIHCKSIYLNCDQIAGLSNLKFIQNFCV